MAKEKKKEFGYHLVMRIPRDWRIIEYIKKQKFNSVADYVRELIRRDMVRGV